MIPSFSDRCRIGWKENQIYYLVSLFCLLLMIISISWDSLWFASTCGWFESPEAKEAIRKLGMEYGYVINHFTDALYFYFKVDSHWIFDYDIVFGTVFFQLLIPFLAVIPAYRIYKEMQSVYHMKAYRQSSYPQFLWKQILSEAVKLSVSVFGAYLIYLFLCMALENTYGDWILHELLLDILGKDFYHSHMHLYYVLEGSIRFFLIPLLYSILSECYALTAGNAKQAILFPFAYYYGLTAVSFLLIRVFGTTKALLYLCPTTIMANGDYETVSTPAILAVHVLPLLIGYVLIKHHVRTREL